MSLGTLRSFHHPPFPSCEDNGFSSAVQSQQSRARVVGAFIARPFTAKMGSARLLAREMGTFWNRNLCVGDKGSNSEPCDAHEISIRFPLPSHRPWACRP